MNDKFYHRLASSNIRKNGKTYFPYILTCIFTVAMYYIMKSLSLNKGLKDVLGADTVITVLKLGSGVIAIFSFIFLFYTNSFLTKKRKKEFGLLNILGMEKKHISRMIGYESIYVMIISLTGGIGLGVLLDKLMYVAVSRLIKTDIPLGFYFSWEAAASTLILFGILFYLIFLNSMRMIHLSNPVELLKGGNTGEKEPKAKWIIAVTGVICLGTGYYFAFTVKNPIMALSMFFVAVLLVIIGTYLIFTAGTIAFLKILKKNKKYYYKTNHFISVSGMIYRMKQDAVGLANICVLSTMVLVMVSSTTSLIVGTKEIIKERYPYQLEIGQTMGDKEEFESLKTAVREIAGEENVEIKSEVSFSDIQFQMIQDGDLLRGAESYDDMGTLDNVFNIFVVTAEDYSAYTGNNAVLSDDEVILWQNGKRYKYNKDHFRIFDKEYKITDVTDKFIDNVLVNEVICPTLGIVVSDYSVIEEMYAGQKKIYGKNASEIEHKYGINIDGNKEKQLDFKESIEKNIWKYHESENSLILNCREEKKKDVYYLYGSLFFLGIFLGLLFIMATVLIIYYKQISEGYDDKGRFEIMQKVGMNEREVKESIHSQILTVFFMPLIVAGIHTAAAFPIVRKILAMLQLTDVKLFAICNLGVAAVFTLVYALIYLMTARVYYRIVKK